MAYIALPAVAFDPQGGQESPFEVPSHKRLCFLAVAEMFPIMVTTYTVVKSQCLMYSAAVPNPSGNFDFLLLAGVLMPPLIMGILASMVITSVLLKRACYYWFLKRGSLLIKFKDRSYFRAAIFWLNVIGAFISLAVVGHLTRNLLNDVSLESWFSYLTVVVGFLSGNKSVSRSCFLMQPTSR